MNLMKDAFVISCHETNPTNPVSWKDGSLGTVVCSECGSIHPDEFINQLKTGGFQDGFHWYDSSPFFANTEIGPFYAAHLRDMPVQWLFENAQLIFDTTGIIFYWDRESPNWQSVAENFRMGTDSESQISLRQRANAEKIIHQYFYNHR